MGEESCRCTNLFAIPQWSRCLFTRPIVARVSFGVFLLLFIIGAGFLVLHFMDSDAFTEIVDWLHVHRIVGGVIYASLFCFFVILCFPSTLFEVLAGFVFGVPLGFFIAFVAKSVGSLISFLVARFFLRNYVKHKLEVKYRIFGAIASLVDSQEMKIVFLVRIAFFPIALKNYGLGSLDVSFQAFALATLITGIPFTLLWCYIGHAAKHLRDLIHHSDKQQSTFEIIVVLVGVIAAVAVFIYIGLYTRSEVERITNRKLKEESAASSVDGKEKERRPSHLALIHPEGGTEVEEDDIECTINSTTALQDTFIM